MKTTMKRPFPGPARGRSGPSASRILQAASLTTLLLMSQAAGAQVPQERYIGGGKLKESEYALLPRYCLFVPAFNAYVPERRKYPAEAKYWDATIGRMYGHFHHYCRGIAYTNRATLLPLSRANRQRSLRASLTEFDYVIRHANEEQPDFFLLPEFHYRLGHNQVQLGMLREGLVNLEKSIRIKPDYWPPYASLGDYYKAAGEPAKARDWLEKGLSAAPGTKALQQRLAELDGGKGKASIDPSQRPAPKPVKPSPAEQAAPGPPEVPATDKTQ